MPQIEMMKPGMSETEAQNLQDIRDEQMGLTPMSEVVGARPRVEITESLAQEVMPQVVTIEVESTDSGPKIVPVKVMAKVGVGITETEANALRRETDVFAK